MNQLAVQPKTISAPNGAGDEPPPHPGFDAPSSAPAPAKLFEQGERSQATQIEQARAIAEVQAAVMVAQRAPRDMKRALEEMRKVCTIEMMADRAFFAYEKGGKTVSRGSIHLAREMARIWGNIGYGTRELSRKDVKNGEPYGESEMLAFAWDLQTNARPETTFIVPHYMDLKGGAKKILKDARSIYENNANMAARRLREQILAVIPRWFTDEAEDLCRRTLELGDGKPIKERIATAVTHLKTVDVTPEMIEKKFGCAITALGSVHLADLKIIYRSLKNGEITRDEAFPETPAADVEKAMREKASAQPKPEPDNGAAGPANRPSGEPGQAQDQAAPRPQQQAPSPIDHSGTVKVLLEKIEKAATAKALDNLVNASFAEDIDQLRTDAGTEAQAQYKIVQDAIDKRRKWFAR